MKNTKKSLSIIAVMLLTALIFSLGAFSAGAQANVGDSDIYGTPIADMMFYFGSDGIEDMYTNLDVEENLGTFVFVDEELLSYEPFLVNLVDALIDENYPYLIDTSLTGKLASLAPYNIFILVYRGNNLFEDICTAAYNDYYGTNYTEYYNFTIDEYKDWLYSLVNNAYMCAFGIWVLPAGLEDMLTELQDEWNNEMPIYIILKEPLIHNPNATLVKIFAWLGSAYGFLD